MRGFDYSKWDKLELSDDEDTHPGAKFVEEQTLRRIKRESHKIKEKERQEKIDELEADNKAGMEVDVFFLFPFPTSTVRELLSLMPTH